MDDALRRSDEQFRELFEHAADGIFIADLDGRYTDVNRAGCELLGYARDELVGKTILDLIDPADAPRLWLSREALLRGDTETAEWTLRCKDGSRVPVEVSARILSDGRWLGFVRDVTERRRAFDATRAMAAELERRVAQRTAQLRALAADLEAAENRERRQISQDLHDDLAQTLATARIRLSALARDVRPDVRAAAAEVESLIVQADRSTRALAAQLAPAVLYELGLVPALEWLAEQLAASHGLEVDVRDDGAAKPLSQEARSILYRAVRELLINVAKHADTDRAAVEVRRDGDRIVLRISDTGIGFRVPPVSMLGGERGFGLVSVRERLKFIGGTADIRSVPGDGTEARLCAPLDTAGAAVAPEAIA